MIDLVKDCIDLILQLKQICDEMKDNWDDCQRLCQRCQIFQDTLLKYEKNQNKGEENESRDILPSNDDKALLELQDCLRNTNEFVRKYTQRTCYRGMTRLLFRQQYSKEIVCLNQSIDHCALVFHISLNLTNEQRRQQDVEDCKRSFETLIDKVSEEMIESVEDSIEEGFQELKEDISQFQSSLNHLLLSYQYKPLTSKEMEELNDTLLAKLMKQLDERQKELLKHLREIRFSQVSINKNVHNIRFMMLQLMEDQQQQHQQQKQQQQDNSHETMMRKEKLARLRLDPHEVSIERQHRLGKGGYGLVLYGKLRNKTPIAVKVLKLSHYTIRDDNEPGSPLTPRSSQDEQYLSELKAIENEILLLDYLHDPFIINIYGYVVSPTEVQVALELSPYGSLEKILYNQRSSVHSMIPLSLLISWLCDLSLAIEFLHKKRIKHRDIKAENVLVFNGLRLKLTDFGSAKLHMTTAPGNKALQSVVAGTTAFMAPEIRNGKKSAFASDIFSIGMTAVQILSRKAPHAEDVTGQILLAVKRAIERETNRKDTTTATAWQITPADLNRRLCRLLLSCVAYTTNPKEEEINVNTLRPTATYVSYEFQSLLKLIGDDPRGHNTAWIHTLEDEITKSVRRQLIAEDQLETNQDSEDQKKHVEESNKTVKPLRQLSQEECQVLLKWFGVNPSIQDETKNQRSLQESSSISIDGELLELVETSADLEDIGITLTPLLTKKLLRKLSDYRREGVPLNLLQDPTEETEEEQREDSKNSEDPKQALIKRFHQQHEDDFICLQSQLKDLECIESFLNKKYWIPVQSFQNSLNELSPLYESLFQEHLAPSLMNYRQHVLLQQRIKLLETNAKIETFLKDVILFDRAIVQLLQPPDGRRTARPWIATNSDNIDKNMNHEENHAVLEDPTYQEYYKATYQVIASYSKRTKDQDTIDFLQLEAYPHDDGFLILGKSNKMINEDDDNDKSPVHYETYLTVEQVLQSLQLISFDEIHSLSEWNRLFPLIELNSIKTDDGFNYYQVLQSRSSNREVGIEIPSSVQDWIAQCDGSIERTVSLCESWISRPKLTPKLLEKPPFLFIRDVIRSIILKTRFAWGLYSKEELDLPNDDNNNEASNEQEDRIIKRLLDSSSSSSFSSASSLSLISFNSLIFRSKQGKLLFLNKLIHFLSYHLQRDDLMGTNTIDPLKILAGLNPNQSNVLLQLFVVASKYYPNHSNVSVQRVLAVMYANQCQLRLEDQLNELNEELESNRDRLGQQIFDAL